MLMSMKIQMKEHSILLLWKKVLRNFSVPSRGGSGFFVPDCESLFAADCTLGAKGISR